MNGKFGNNQFSIHVVKSWGDPDTEKRCMWLGHVRYQCGHCKKAYFDVRSEKDYTSECPGCGWKVTFRWGDGH